MITDVTAQTVDAADGGAVTVLRACGELDLASIASLDGAMSAALRAAGPQPRLIIDLSEATVLQPVVVGVLLDARRRCRNAGGAVALVVSGPEIGATLADMGVEALFETTNERAAAIRHVSNR